MNDTLPKPFDEAELLSKLASLMAGVQGPLVDAALAAAAPGVTPASAPLFDLTLLHQTAHGNATFINRILTSFHMNTPASVADLHAALTATDWHAAAAVAHKLRPSLTLIGAATLVPWLEALERQTAPDATRHEATRALAAGLTALLAALPTA